MPKAWTNRKPCRLCNSRKLTPTATLSPTPPESCFTRPDGTSDCDDRIPLILSFCEKCKLIQQQAVVDPKLLFSKSQVHSRICRRDEAIATSYAQEVTERARLKKDDLVVHIGPADRTLLQLFRNGGLKVVTIDPGPAPGGNGDYSPHYESLFTPALASTVREENGYASVILVNHVLGETDNLHAFTAGVRYLLKPDGLLFIEESSLEDMLNQNRYGLINHGHITYLTAIGLDSFFRSTMMQLIEATQSPEDRGSFRMVVQRDDGPYTKSPSLNAWLENEKASGIREAQTLVDFARRVESTRNDTVKLISAARKAGKVIVGYGASAPAVTIVNYCGWSKDELSFIVSENGGLEGLILPGTNIPVTSPQILDDTPPDIILLLDQDLTDTLRTRLQNFQRDGGKVIQLFPAPRTV